MTLPIQDPTLAAEGLGVPPRRHGFLRSVLRERKTAVIGLAIIVFFILLAVIAPYISPYSATAQTCAVYEPPSAATGSAVTTAASTCSASSCRAAASRSWSGSPPRSWPS